MDLTLPARNIFATRIAVLFYGTIGTYREYSKQQNARRNCLVSVVQSGTLAIQVRSYMYMYHDCTWYMYMYTLSLYRHSGCFQVWPNTVSRDCIIQKINRRRLISYNIYVKISPKGCVSKIYTAFSDS
jgi:hypothetical protein